ncbi:MAG: nitrogen fixation protein NifZ [Rhodocyclales bacterium]|jgi:nitrogen fixation protein NifZ|nr:nitrogen fixation protein NifZ [Rhodocyclales bacterium]
MDDVRIPKFQWGQPVLAVIDLRNDGSYPDCVDDELLAERGTQGEIVQVGSHVDTQTPIYLVEFPNGRVVGCLEEEIIAAALVTG